MKSGLEKLCPGPMAGWSAPPAMDTGASTQHRRTSTQTRCCLTNIRPPITFMSKSRFRL